MFLKDLLRRLLARDRWAQGPHAWPSKEQWLRAFFALSLRERIAFAGSATLIGAGILIWGTLYFNAHTRWVPAEGGSYTEGIIGQPRYINPVLAASNTADRDITQLVFAGLTKYDESGNIAPDLAERWDILEDGKVYEFHLRPDLIWPDGEALTAEDVIFTIQKIQNPAIRNALMPNWLSVKVEAGADGSIVRFILPSAYAPFLHNTTVGILPRHLWADVQNENFAGHELNYKPMGSGMYTVSKIERTRPSGSISSLILKPNDKYWGQKPYIQTLKIEFFDTAADAVNAYNRKDVDGVGDLDATTIATIRPNSTIEESRMPRYFAAFFNQTQSKPLADKNVRIALSHATDKNTLLSEIWADHGDVIHSPILPDMLGYDPNTPAYQYDQERAKQLLNEAGWTDSDNNGVRDKKGVQLAFTLTTLDTSELTRTAEMLKAMWETIGAKVEIRSLDGSSLREQAIRPRSYEILLFGYELAPDPDPFSFWHSSQRFDPWPNLALYNNKEADKLLEEARQKTDPARRAELYNAFQKTLVQDAPAIFLVSPRFLYPTISSLKGADFKFLPNPSWRFGNANLWFLRSTIQWER